MPARTKHADPQAFSVSRADTVTSLPTKEPDAIAAVPTHVPAYAIAPKLWARWFNTYRRLFSIVCTANLVIMLLAATGAFRSGHNHAIAWAVGNVLVSVMFRNELFLWSLVYVPLVHGCRLLNAPLWVKHRVTDILLHLGGVHSGAGASSILWVGLAIGQQLSHVSGEALAAMVLAWIILALLLTTVAAACPELRWHHHNAFEHFHRFAGWSCLAALWILLLVGQSWSPTDRRYHPRLMLRSPELWMTAAITLLIAAPWLCVCRVPVQTAVPSPGTVVLKFRGGMADGFLGRISRHLLLEWHAFGTLSSRDSDSHLMVIVARGDWTQGLIKDPPKHLWVRTFRFAGLPYTARMLHSFVFVATGAGIGVALSSVLQLASVMKAFLIWVAKEPEVTYGPEVLQLVHAIAPERRLIIDTATQQRPDIPALVAETAASEQADTVYIVSNPQLTDQIWRSCGERGIVAFGPIWDS